MPNHFRGLLWATLFACAAVATHAQQDSAAKGGKGYFHSGTLVKIEDSMDLSSQGTKAEYIIFVQDGDAQYFGHVKLTYLQHDHRKDLEVGKPVQYRLDGKNMIVKTSKGDEIKTRLCARQENCVKCGSVMMCGI
ncbi:MAG TPA: hypothetical protein VMT51_03630 [Dongiaceae bacterium]|nr:hypothetical protein [Dongiaceae bacterium]